MNQPPPTGRPSNHEPPPVAGEPADDDRPDTERPALTGTGKALVARGAELMDRLAAKRSDNPAVEVGFRWIPLDREIAGGVLGGGLAYRFFFWTLSWSVLTAGGLGFASRSSNLETAAEDVGLADSVADTVATAGQQAESSRWWLLLVGIWLVLWFSWGLLRALWLTHAAAWRIPPPYMKNGPRAYAVVLAAAPLIAAASAAAGWVRENVDPAAGIVVTIVVSLAFGAGWWWVSWKLPHRDVPWTALWPGSALMAVGFAGLHFFTVLYLAEKLANSSELYGALGLAATMLFYLFCVGRGVIWAAELNALVWDVRQGQRRRRDGPGVVAGGDGEGAPTPVEHLPPAR